MVLKNFWKRCDGRCDCGHCEDETRQVCASIGKGKVELEKISVKNGILTFTVAPYQATVTLGDQVLNKDCQSQIGTMEFPDTCSIPNWTAPVPVFFWESKCTVSIPVNDEDHDKILSASYEPNGFPALRPDSFILKVRKFWFSNFLWTDAV